MGIENEVMIVKKFRMEKNFMTVEDYWIGRSILRKRGIRSRTKLREQIR
jgi:hypothetical protein